MIMSAILENGIVRFLMHVGTASVTTRDLCIFMQWQSARVSFQKKLA